jgi:prepilin-type N-terminal cleavage/methylation domain-containing protein
MNMFKKKNRKGFTLIELIVVIAILAILAAIAIPTFIGVTQNATNTVVIANARTLVSSINAFNALNPGGEISSITVSAAGVTALKGQLGTWWPGSLTDADALAAVARITMASNVASVS